MVGARQKEIGIHAVRGGTLAGEHSVLYLGQDEVLEFTHQATSRQIFVNGAIKAAMYVSDKKRAGTRWKIWWKDRSMEAQEIIDFIHNAEKKTPGQSNL